MYASLKYTGNNNDNAVVPFHLPIIAVHAQSTTIMKLSCIIASDRRYHWGPSDLVHISGASVHSIVLASCVIILKRHVHSKNYGYTAPGRVVAWRGAIATGIQRALICLIGELADVCDRAGGNRRAAVDALGWRAGNICR
nr:hypothetical protein CFP56_03324 [Quercus suber]